MENIYLDYDSTLVNTAEVYLRKVNEKYKVSHTLSDMTHYSFMIDKYGDESSFWKVAGFYSEVFPYNKSQWFVQQLKRLVGPKNVFIITASPRNMRDEKSKHIKYFYDIPNTQVYHEHEKYKFTHDGVLVDDNREQIIEHVMNTTQDGILFKEGTYGWNVLSDEEKELHVENGKIVLAHTYSDVLTYVKKCFSSKESYSLRASL